MEIISDEKLATLFDTIYLTDAQIAFVHALHQVAIHPMINRMHASPKEQRDHVLRELGLRAQRDSTAKVKSARSKFTAELAINLMAGMDDAELLQSMLEFEHRVREHYDGAEPPTEIAIQVRKGRSLHAA